MKNIRSYIQIKNDYKVSILLAAIIFISCISIWNIEFIGNLLFIFLLPLSVLAIPIWIIILLIKWAKTKVSRIVPIIVVLTPILIFPILKFQKILEPPIFLKGISLNTIDGEHLKLYKNGTFQYKYSSFLGTKKYNGNHETKGDTIILTFKKDKPEYIENKTTKWVIEENQFIEPSEGLYFDIIKQ